MTVLISAKQKGVIDDLAKLIMRARAHDDTPTEGRERITANTVLRVLIDLLDEKLQPIRRKRLTMKMNYENG